MHRSDSPAACTRQASQPFRAGRVAAGRAAPARLGAALAAAVALIAASPLWAAGGEAAGSPDGVQRASQRPAFDASTRPAAASSGNASATAMSADAVVLYRSIMPNGRTVIGDRPEPGARRVETIGSVPAGDRADVVRARQEREYWRQRAEAFAARHAQRQRELEAERDERHARAERERALHAARVLVAPPIVYGAAYGAGYDRLGLAPVLPVAGAYTTSPGAAGRNLGAQGSTGLGFGAPLGFVPGADFGVVVPGAGFGGFVPGGFVPGGFAPGAAPGASIGFIGSGFATSGR